MSRVIKSSTFLEDQPRLLELVDFGVSQDLTDVSETDTQDVSSVESAEVQAERILEETRLAVLDLLAKAREQANLIVSQAKAEAEMIVSTAHTEAENLRKLEAERGYKEGYEQALVDARSQGEAIIAEAYHEVEAARQAKLAYINNQEKEIVELAVLIAEKILQYEVGNKPDVVVKIAVNALNKVRDMSQVVLKVHPQDFGLIQAIKPELMGMVKGLRALAVEKDQAVDPGGCIIDTGNGYVDARIDAQLAEMRRVLRDLMDR